jgi:hypothetical protein
MTPYVFLVSVLVIRKDWAGGREYKIYGTLVTNTANDYTSAKESATQFTEQKARTQFPKENGWSDPIISIGSVSATEINEVYTHIHGDDL